MYDNKVLYGSQATQELDKYIRKLEKREVKGLTEKQVYALVKTAKILRNEITRSNSNLKADNSTTDTFNWICAISPPGF
jgi:hypothetical protein